MPGVTRTWASGVENFFSLAAARKSNEQVDISLRMPIFYFACGVLIPTADNILRLRLIKTIAAVINCFVKRLTNSPEKLTRKTKTSKNFPHFADINANERDSTC